MLALGMTPHAKHLSGNGRMLDKAFHNRDLQYDDATAVDSSVNDEFARMIIERFRPRLLEEIDRQIGDYLRKRFDEEDIVQSAFCSFFRRANQGQYQFDHSNALFRLLLTIATNKLRRAARHHTRGRRDVRKEAAVTANEVEPSDKTWENELTQGTSDIVMRVGEIVDRLPERNAEFFRRRYVENHSFGRISADLNWSVSTIKRVLRETREKIRDQIDPDLQIGGF